MFEQVFYDKTQMIRIHTLKCFAEEALAYQLEGNLELCEKRSKHAYMLIECIDFKNTIIPKAVKHANECDISIQVVTSCVITCDIYGCLLSVSDTEKSKQVLEYGWGLCRHLPINSLIKESFLYVKNCLATSIHKKGAVFHTNEKIPELRPDYMQESGRYMIEFKAHVDNKEMIKRYNENNHTCFVCEKGSAKPCESCKKIYYCSEECKLVHSLYHNIYCRKKGKIHKCAKCKCTTDQKCSKCKKTYYCSLKCQEEDLKLHEKHCK